MLLLRYKKTYRTSTIVDSQVEGLYEVTQTELWCVLPKTHVQRVVTCRLRLLDKNR